MRAVGLKCGPITGDTPRSRLTCSVDVLLFCEFRYKGVSNFSLLEGGL
jgi:hypothetical protein